MGTAVTLHSVLRSWHACLFAPLVLLYFNCAAAEETRTLSRPENQTFDALEVAVEWSTRAVEAAGILANVGGALLATGLYLYEFAGGGSQRQHYDRFRSRLGRSILLGLEFLVAADIIATVAIDPSLESVAVLAGIVAIRTFLSFTLALEIDGRWPWQSRRDEMG
jgi:uncharacterized membrane protein